MILFRSQCPNPTIHCINNNNNRSIKDMVLTAAHCEDRDLEANRAISFGNLDFKDEDDADYLAYPIDYWIHPDYTYREGDNFDLMLMLLDQEIGVTPAKLNSDSSIPSIGESLTVMGFGFEDEDADEQSDVLLDVQVDYIEDCKNEDLYPDYADYRYLNPGPDGEHMCAGVSNGGEDACVGDR